MASADTPRKLVNLIGDAIAENADDAKLADIINEHFLFGVWGDHAMTMPPEFLKNIRGLIVTAYRVGFARGSENS